MNKTLEEQIKENSELLTKEIITQEEHDQRRRIILGLRILFTLFTY